MNDYVIGNKLKEARRKIGKTQKQVATEMGISRTNITKYENDDLEPNLCTLKKISEIYKVSIDYILGILNENDLSSDSDEYELIQIYNKLSHLNKVRVLERARGLLEYEMDKRRKNDNR